MAIDTKPNFSCKKFEQCATDIMNLSGCTQIYGKFDIESGATLTICDNLGAGKVLTSDASGVAGWQTPAAQGITSITGGSGMNFTEITSTGGVVLGTPSKITNSGTTVSSGTTHNHYFMGQSFVSGTQGILVDGNNRFYLDDTYVTDQTLPSLYGFSGITGNSSIGALPSGQTLGMVYITNTGTTTGYFNLGTTPEGDDITPYQTIQVDPNEDVSITINMRLSLDENKTIYVSSTDWTDVGINLQWANITYQNASTTINPGDLPVASTTTVGVIQVGNGLEIDGSGVLTVVGGGTVTGATNLGTGNGQIYSGLTVKDLNFKTISGGTDIEITTNSNYIGINFTGSSGGGTITGGTNGLCADGKNVVLGGVLTGETIICVVDNTSLTFTDNRTTAVGIQYGADYSTNQTCLSIPNVGWVTGGTGGFLGTVTDVTVQPTDLRNNQWVKPEPNASNCFNYVFSNFCDSGALPINVNLSLEDVYLRYQQNGDYWIKESYYKPLSSGHTWMGDSSCRVCEIPVIDEWVGTPEDINYAGQKYSYVTQNIFQVDIGTCATIANKMFVESIDLKTVGDTCIFTIPEGKTVFISSAKLIMLNDASPTSFCVSIGNNCCTTPTLSFQNMISTTQIDDVLTREVYDITPVQSNAAYCTGTCCLQDVCFRVQSASTSVNPLCAHLLVEGFIY